MLNAAVKLFIRAFMFVLYCISIPGAWIRGFKKPQRCPPVTNKILIMTASELATKIRQREV